MSRMYDQTARIPTSDVRLMLRVDAEQRWLSREVIPVLRQLRDPAQELPEEQLGAALAYLEIVWLEARRLAAETDGAFAELERAHVDTAETLPTKARDYHAAVRTLRAAAERNVNALVSPPCEELHRLIA